MFSCLSALAAVVLLILLLVGAEVSAKPLVTRCYASRYEDSCYLTLLGVFIVRVPYST